MLPEKATKFPDNFIPPPPLDYIVSPRIQQGNDCPGLQFLRLYVSHSTAEKLSMQMFANADHACMAPDMRPGSGGTYWSSCLCVSVSFHMTLTHVLVNDATVDYVALEYVMKKDVSLKQAWGGVLSDVGMLCLAGFPDAVLCFMRRTR